MAAPNPNNANANVNEPVCAGAAALPGNANANALTTRLELIACAMKIRNWMIQMPNDVQQEFRTEFGVMCRTAGLEEIEGLRIIQDVVQLRAGAVQAFVGQVSRNAQLTAAVRKLAGLL
jgi:hypothetical protein